MTGTFDVTLHKLMSFCHNPRSKLVDTSIESNRNTFRIKIKIVFNTDRITSLMNE